MKSILYWFTDSQIILICHKVLKTSFILNEPNKVALHSNSNITSKHAPQVDLIIDFLYKTIHGK